MLFMTYILQNEKSPWDSIPQQYRPIWLIHLPLITCNHIIIYLHYFIVIIVVKQFKFCTQHTKLTRMQNQIRHLNQSCYKFKKENFPNGTLSELPDLKWVLQIHGTTGLCSGLLKKHSINKIYKKEKKGEKPSRAQDHNKNWQIQYRKLMRCLCFYYSYLHCYS